MQIYSHRSSCFSGDYVFLEYTEELRFSYKKQLLELLKLQYTKTIEFLYC